MQKTERIDLDCELMRLAAKLLALREVEIALGLGGELSRENRDTAWFEELVTA